MRSSLFCALWLAAASASAADGAFEINQTCAVSTGCFAGDTPGFPVTIAAGGSYRLTGNLVVPDVDTTAIRPTAAAPLTIDLGGFSIEGPYACTPGACAAPGTGRGIGFSGNASGTAVTVLNGTVRGVGDTCIALRTLARVEGVFVSNCGGHGISVGTASVVLGNRALNVRLHGLSTAPGTAFADNAFSQCGLGQVAGQTLAVNGGSATGGNACDDGSCSLRGARRFYLTAQPVTGGDVLSACAAGFRVASTPELQDPSTLEYEPSLGFVPTRGAGPPVQLPASVTGGWLYNGVVGLDGQFNCLNWTNSAGFFGAYARYIGGTGQSVALVEDVAICNQPRPVWCLEE